jgi:phosphoenolpyruvate carboxykinase (ATP)
MKYAQLLAEKMKRHGSNVWLVNTGWSGGAHGVGKRMKLSITRAIIDAIHSGKLAQMKTVEDPVFGVGVVADCPNVPPEILTPKKAWADGAAYDATAKKLSGLFQENFRKYAEKVDQDVREAGPRG